MISLSLSLEREFDNYVSVMLPYIRTKVYIFVPSKVWIPSFVTFIQKLR